jgi:hypothetical protein
MKYSFGEGESMQLWKPDEHTSIFFVQVDFCRPQHFQNEKLKVKYRFPLPFEFIVEQHNS